MVVARKLTSSGGDVRVVVIGREERFKGIARKNYERALRMGVPITFITEDLEKLRMLLDWSEVVIDAIFGTGLSRKVTGFYRRAIEEINRSGKPVVSVDIPSGINGNTGEVMGVAVRAKYTVTFGLPKLGNIFYPGYEYNGELYVSHISYPPQLSDLGEIKVMINDLIPLPPRKRDGHKGTFGRGLFIAGAFGYFGAPYFSSMAFLKAGGGYSRLATPKSILPFIANKGSEVVYIPMDETEAGSIAMSNLEKIISLSELSDIVVIGPGVSLNPETKELMRMMVRVIDKPVVVDGDGLTAVSEDTEIIRRRTSPTILTPHLGEMSRLTGLRIDEISKNKIEVLRETVKEFNAIIVLKGAHSLIGYPDGTIYVNMSGNHGMATAGSGDVLSGKIAALYGLGLTINEAARIGVFIHGLAGDIAAEHKGEDGITAQDILNYLPEAMKMYRENLQMLREKYYVKIV